MIKLNLLPQEYQKKKASVSLEQLPDATKVPLQLMMSLPLKQLYLYVGGGLLGIYTLVSLFTLFNIHTLKNLKEKWEQTSSERQKITGISKEYSDLDMKEKAVQKLHSSFRWSQKLQELSGSVVRGVWLRELSLGRRLKPSSTPAAPGTTPAEDALLILTGSAASTRGDHTAIVGRFIRSLKENKNFIEDFADVELESTRLRTIQTVDVMDFKIICTFREGILD